MPKSSMPRFEFWFDPDFYTVQGAKTMYSTGTKDDISAMRSEYTRMRDVAQKRIKRLGEQMSQTKAYQNNRGGFPKLKDIDSRDFPKAFAELAKFVKAKGSSVTGQKQIRRKTIKSWQEQGLDLNEENYDMTIKILEEMRKRKITYDSEKAVSLADRMLEFDDSQVNNWLDNLQPLLEHTEELSAIEELKGVLFDEVIKMITGV